MSSINCRFPCRLWHVWTAHLRFLSPVWSWVRRCRSNLSREELSSSLPLFHDPVGLLMKGFPIVAWFLWSWGIGKAFWQMTFLTRPVHSREPQCAYRNHTFLQHIIYLLQLLFCQWVLLKTTMQEYTPDPEVKPLACFIASLVCPSNRNISLHPGSRLIQRGFPEVSSFFVFEKA